MLTVPCRHGTGCPHKSRRYRRCQCHLDQRFDRRGKGGEAEYESHIVGKRPKSMCASRTAALEETTLPALLRRRNTDIAK